jgi:signal transduction protein with GAF and PtsI domain
MAKVLKFKEVSSDVESRMKDFEKIRIKLKADIKKAEAKKAASGKEGKGLFKSISEFFSDTPKTTAQQNVKK